MRITEADSNIRTLAQSSDVRAREPFEELSLKLPELTEADSLPHAAHRVKEERQIVMRQQHARQHLAALIQMAYVRARMSAANRAPATLVERLRVFCKATVSDVQFSGGSPRLSRARVPRRQYTIKHINAALNRLK